MVSDDGLRVPKVPKRGRTIIGGKQGKLGEIRAYARLKGASIRLGCAYVDDLWTNAHCSVRGSRLRAGVDRTRPRFFRFTRESATSWAICMKLAAIWAGFAALRHLMPMVRFPAPFNGMDLTRHVFCMRDCSSVMMVTRSVCATMDSTSVRLVVMKQFVGHGTPAVMNNASMWRL